VRVRDKRRKERQREKKLVNERERHSEKQK